MVYEIGTPATTTQSPSPRRLIAFVFNALQNKMSTNVDICVPRRTFHRAQSAPSLGIIPHMVMPENDDFAPPFSGPSVLNSTAYGERHGQNRRLLDDFWTTAGRPDDDPMTTRRRPGDDRMTTAGRSGGDHRFRFTGHATDADLATATRQPSRHGWMTLPPSAINIRVIYQAPIDGRPIGGRPIDG